MVMNCSLESVYIVRVYSANPGLDLPNFQLAGLQVWYHCEFGDRVVLICSHTTFGGES